jgi:tetratricopeptide (TPR) repeat protein
VGAIGDDLRMDYTAVGDTTNLAARMEDMANPGTILMSKNTHRLVRDYFELESLGKVEVKGKEEPQEAFELIKTGEVATRIGASVVKGLTRFVGRKRSMAALMEAFDKVKSGSGQVIGIVGEAGVGKSRVLLEMRNVLPQGEYTYVEGRCLHFGGSMAYLPILDILRSYFEIKEGDREFLIKKKMEEKIFSLDEKLRGVIPPFQELLSLKVDDEDFQKLEPKEKREKIFEAIRDLMIRLSQEKPLVLAIEDLHWMDKTSEEFLNYLIGWLANTPILLILLYRPEYTHQWGSKSYYTKIGLDQLGIESSSELVRAILEEGEVAPELKQLILNRAAGNPLFMEEFTQTLLENGSIEKRDKEFVLSRKASDIQIPDTIQGIISARMDRLEDNLKRTMQVASVIGRDFAFRILQTITGMRQELKSYLLNLQGLEFIYEKRLFPELEYIFKHALTQEVAYNSLLQKRRQEIHERIGRAIESLYSERLEEFYEALAFHYGRSDNKVKAIEYLDLANQKAVELSAMEEAKAYFDEAMKLLDELPDSELNQKRRISFLVNQWAAFLLLLKQTEYYDLLTRYEPMAVGLGDPDLLGAFYACLGSCEWWFGLLSKSVQTLTEAARLCEEVGDAERAGNASMSLQWSYMWMGDFEKAIALKEDVLRLSERAFDSRTYVLSMSATSMAYSQMGQWDHAIKDGHEGLKVAEEYSNNSLASFAAFAIALANILENKPRQALDFAELAVQKAPTIGDKVFSQSGLSWALCRSGEALKGVALGTELIPMFQAVRFVPGEIWETVILGEGFFLTGEYVKATQTIKKALELAEGSEMKFFIGWAYRLLGEIALKTNPTQAAHHFDKSISVLKEIKAENELAMAYAGYGRFHKQQGNIAEVREYLTNALEIFERLGTLIQPDKVREELAGLPEG